MAINGRKRLSDILRNGNLERLAKIWETTKPAEDLKPIPPGEYHCRIIEGKLDESKSGTPGYKLTFEVIDGEHAGRRLWCDVWLTGAAARYARRDLAKLGIESLEQLEKPLPDGMIVAAKVALRKGDDGAEFNRITRFDLFKIEKPEPDPYAPTDEDGFNWSNGEQGGAPTS